MNSGSVFGVDEAGKGPVLGPMVAACVAGPTAALPTGVDDSKQVAPARRVALAERLMEHDDVAVGIARVPPTRIDDGPDMNTLTVEAHAAAIEDAGATGEGLLDAADVDPARFARRVTGAVDTTVTLDAVHGADETDPHVGAASVVAKVTRDRAIETLADRHGAIGSGYPSDATTRTFLREYVRDHGTLPDCARRSWKTARDALAAAEQAGLDDF